MAKLRKVPKAYQQVLDQHRRQLVRLTERGGVERAKKLYDEAQAVVTKRLRGLSRARETFTAQQKAQVMGQIKQGQRMVAQRMTGELGDLSKTAQTDALRGLVDNISRLEKHFTGSDIVLPIDEAARFRGIVDGRRESLLRSHAESIDNYGDVLVGKMEDQLSLSMVAGEHYGEAIERIEDTAGLEWWQGERIVRTELVGAFNATAYDGMREMGRELDDLGMRWVEYVDDDTGEPRDDRVSDDSLAMHGQVAPVSGRFYFPNTMPGGEPLPKSCQVYVGKSWLFPPLRPNGRESISPWRPHWGIPAWRFANGRRVEM